MTALGARSRMAALTAVLIAAVPLWGCLPPRVTVLPSGTAVRAEPKPSDCQLEFLRTKVDRPYDEIAGLQAAARDALRAGPDDVHGAIRAKACALGADAVIVVHDFSERRHTMDVVAIKYRDVAAGHQ